MPESHNGGINAILPEKIPQHLANSLGLSCDDNAQSAAGGLNNIVKRE